MKRCASCTTPTPPPEEEVLTTKKRSVIGVFVRGDCCRKPLELSPLQLTG